MNNYKDREPTQLDHILSGRFVPEFLRKPREFYFKFEPIADELQRLGCSLNSSSLLRKSALRLPLGHQSLTLGIPNENYLEVEQLLIKQGIVYEKVLLPPQSVLHKAVNMLIPAIRAVDAQNRDVERNHELANIEILSMIRKQTEQTTPVTIYDGPLIPEHIYKLIRGTRVKH